MKYWGLLAAKLLAAALALQGLWIFTLYLFPKPALEGYYYRDAFLHDLPYTLRVFGFGLLCVGLVYAIFWDQDFRCRTCLRRLRMPVETGSWKNMILFGPPRVEYICVYGHGTLLVPEVHISGMQTSDWQPNEDMWKELTNLEATRK